MISQKNRFKGHKSLNYVYRHGQTIRKQMFAIKYAHNRHRSDWRLAVVVSKKVQPSAVHRNRIRRRLYEVVRNYALENPIESYDMVLTVYDANVETVESKELQNWVKDVLTTISRS